MKTPVERSWSRTALRPLEADDRGGEASADRGGRASRHLQARGAGDHHGAHRCGRGSFRADDLPDASEAGERCSSPPPTRSGNKGETNSNPSRRRMRWITAEDLRIAHRGYPEDARGPLPHRARGRLAQRWTARALERPATPRGPALRRHRGRREGPGLHPLGRGFSGDRRGGSWPSIGSRPLPVCTVSRTWS